MTIRTRLAFVLAMLAPPLFAALPPHPERFLIPVTSAPTPGAFGSRWVTEVWFRNEGTKNAWVYPVALGDYFVAPGTTLLLQISQPPPGHAPGQFIYVPEVADHAHFNVRVQDVSRQALTWGTEIPVIRDSQLTSGGITLINIPTDTRFRSALRIYEAGLEGAGRVRVAIFENNGKVALATEELAMPVDGLAIYSPGYAQVLSLRERYPAIAAVERIRVEITPLTEGSRIWAFVAVTNNETQHVTTITPQ